MKKPTKILCTLGPSSFDKKIILRLDDLGVSLFRINLSHTKISELSSLIKHIKSVSDVPICLDTEGAQIRTGEINDSVIELSEHSELIIKKDEIVGSNLQINFMPVKSVDNIEIGDFISIDFDSVLIQVTNKTNEELCARVLNGGIVGKNKAITVMKDIPLPPLSTKDIEAIKIGLELGLKHYALSFANSPDDVKKIRNLIGKKSFLISKIESLSGLKNLNQISTNSDALLIDRGDLSRQLPIELIPKIQKMIIKTAKELKTPVYVATNLLESMVSNASPTRAEVNDIYNTLLDGANALVLAAETAIGNYPLACVSMIKKIIHNFETPTAYDINSIPLNNHPLLIDPHGGFLIQRYANDAEKNDIPNMDVLVISHSELMDCELIANGTYSPLTGFMDKETLDSVLENFMLLDGNIWTLPILLSPKNLKNQNLSIGKKVALKGEDGFTYAILEVSDIFNYDVDVLANKCFGTDSSNHPGVKQLFENGGNFISGEIKLVKKPISKYRYLELSPNQTRYIFSHKGWSKVIGFHTRNPIHRAHEYLQFKALEMTNADGIYINPVLGSLKPGDFKHNYIIESYNTMINSNIYPQNKVLLGSFATYPRFAGPREAVFTAICRKNMGCSHFIIGRDHNGVDNFYNKNANLNLFNKLGDIGIIPLFFGPISFNIKKLKYEEDVTSQDNHSISGSKIRELLKSNNKVQNFVMRDIIQKSLLDLSGIGENMFIK